LPRSDDDQRRVIEVTLPLKIPKSLSYLAQGEPLLGSRVIVPLKERRCIGLVTSLEAPEVPDMRPVEEVLDTAPILHEADLSFFRWMADYYLNPLGQIIRYALPRAFFTLPKKKAPERFTSGGPSWTPGPGFSPVLLHDEDEESRWRTYLERMEAALDRGEGVLLLVPERRRAEELLSRLAARFPEPALYHGGLTPNRRMRLWLDVLRGQKKLVLGTRLALFLPFPRLGLIIVEDEEDPAYKEEQAVRYQARDLALMRAKMSAVEIILGSAAPSVKSFYLAKRGRYRLLKGREIPHPDVEIVDLREARGLVSQRLITRTRLTLSRGGQVFFFLNRLGYSPVLQCQTCGHIWTCPHCLANLTYHRDEKKLLCRFCKWELPAPPLCPNCQDTDIKPLGTGTERLLEIVQKIFPQAKVARLDQETAREAIDFEGLDILIGTRKAGRHPPLPRLALVGVILADQLLGLPEWQAAERSYQELKHLSLLPAKTIIQTFHPEHHVFHGLKRGYEHFWAAEIKARQRSGFPPFGRLALLTLEGRDAEHLEEVTERVRLFLEERGLEVFGPREERRKDLFFFSLLVRGSTHDLHRALFELLNEKKGAFLDKCHVQLDFDPD